MGIDSGPFQDITAIAGGIFGKVLSILTPAQRGLYLPGTPLCSTFSLLPVVPTQTPDPLLSGYTTLTVQCFVGSFWDGHPNNPFDTLSQAPADAQDLYDSTVTHDIEGGDSFKPTDVGAVQCGAGTNVANVQTAAGQTYTPSGVFAPTEFFTFRGTNVGNTFELWAVLVGYNDLNGWPGVANRCRFHAAATVDDKILFSGAS